MIMKNTGRRARRWTSLKRMFFKLAYFHFTSLQVAYFTLLQCDILGMTNEDDVIWGQDFVTNERILQESSSVDTK